MNEDTLALLIIFGSGVAIATIAILASLLKTWINRNKSSFDDESFDRLAKTFITYRKDSERRLQNLEAIISGEDSERITGSLTTQLKETKPHHTIEIDADEPKEKSKGHGSNLRNMLKE